MREEEIKQLEIDKIHWRDLYWEECEKNKKLEKENKKLKECNKSQSEVINNVFIPQRERLEEENKKLKEENKKLENK